MASIVVVINCTAGDKNIPESVTGTQFSEVSVGGIVSMSAVVEYESAALCFSDLNSASWSSSLRSISVLDVSSGEVGVSSSGVSGMSRAS